MDGKLPRRRKKKKPRYDFLNKEYIVESEEVDEMDWEEVLVFEMPEPEDD